MHIDKAYKKIVSGKGNFIVFLSQRKPRKKYQVILYKDSGKGPGRYWKDNKPEEVVGIYNQNINLKDLKDDYIITWKNKGV